MKESDRGLHNRGIKGRWEREGDARGGKGVGKKGEEGNGERVAMGKREGEM